MRISRMRCLQSIALFLLALTAVNVVYAPGAVIYMNPSENIFNPEETFTIYINVDSVVDLYAWEIKLTWEPGVLEFVSVVEGSFLSAGGFTFFASTVNQVFGEALFGATLIGAVPGVSGSGELAQVTFMVEEAGKSSLQFSETAMVNSGLVDISHSSKDGEFSTPQKANLVKRSAWPEHHHYKIYPGDEDEYQTLNAKVKNLGPENLTVKVVFNLVRDDGMINITETDPVLLTPGQTKDISVDFGPIKAIHKGKYAVTVHCLYSYFGIEFAGVGDKIKTFSFAAVP